MLTIDLNQSLINVSSQKVKFEKTKNLRKNYRKTNNKGKTVTTKKILGVAPIIKKIFDKLKRK